MTQRTASQRQNEIRDLTTRIRTATGDYCDELTRILLQYAPIDLVAILVGAADRLRGAEVALDEAEGKLNRAKAAIVEKGDGIDHVVREVVAASRGYACALSRSGAMTRSRASARSEFIRSVRSVLAVTRDGRYEVYALALAAMSVAISEETVRAAGIAYDRVAHAIEPSRPG